MSLITALFVAYVVTTTRVKSQFECRSGISPTEEVQLDLITDFSGTGLPAIAIIGAECPGIQQDDGWSFINDAAGNCGKVNWYFQGALNDSNSLHGNWWSCSVPDAVATNPGTGPTDRILLGCLKRITFTLRGRTEATSGIFIRLYTLPIEGDTVWDGSDPSSGNSLKSWYKSRLFISGDKFSPDTRNVNVQQFTTFSVDLPAGYNLPLSQSTNNDFSNSLETNLTTLLNTEEIRAIAFGTSSNVDAATNNFTLASFSVEYDPSCTCPYVRTMNLAATPGSLSGENCAEDVGTCDECTCIQQCVHQDGLNNSIVIHSNIASQEECCALCTADVTCLSYTYIIGIEGLSTYCSEQFAVGDCLLFDSKLMSCNTELEELRYEGVSGSVVDGECNITSSVGDCCDGQGECIMGMCTAPTSAPTPDSPESHGSLESPDSSELHELTESPDSTDSPESVELLEDAQSKPQSQDSGSDSGDDALLDWKLFDKSKNDNKQQSEQTINLNADLSLSWTMLWSMLILIAIVNCALIWCLCDVQKQATSQTFTLPQYCICDV